jgi:hypothetical protein
LPTDDREVPVQSWRLLRVERQSGSDRLGDSVVAGVSGREHRDVRLRDVPGPTTPFAAGALEVAPAIEIYCSDSSIG